MGKLLRRGGERILASVICLILAPVVFCVLLVASVFVLVPGTPLKICWKEES